MYTHGCTSVSVHHIPNGVCRRSNEGGDDRGDGDSPSVDHDILSLYWKKSSITCTVNMYKVILQMWSYSTAHNYPLSLIFLPLIHSKPPPPPSLPLPLTSSLPLPFTSSLLHPSRQISPFLVSILLVEAMGSSQVPATP